MQTPFPIDLTNFATWLASGAAGVVLALLLEKIPAFKGWKSEWKGRMIVVIFVAAPFAGEWLVALFAANPELVAAVQHYLGLAILGLGAWAVSQFAHESDPQRFK